LYKTLKEQIREGKLKPGERLLSSRELRDRFKLSYRATLRAMGRLAREGFVVRRPGSGTYVNEVTDLETLRPHTKALRVLVSLEGPQKLFLQPLVEALADQLRAMECDHSCESVPADRVQESLVTGEAEAFIWVRSSPVPIDIARVDVPVVLVGHDLEVSWDRGTGYDVVTADSRQGGALAARHLRKVGCRNVAIVGVRALGGRRMDPYTVQRVHGFEAAWGQELPEPSIVLGKCYAAATGAGLAAELLALDPLPDGVFATSDELGEGLSHALIAHGVKVGRDVKIIGYDGQPRRSKDDPVLTSVAVPLAALGRAAARMSVQRAADPKGIARRLVLACGLRQGATA